jgi:hypothetical protein
VAAAILVTTLDFAGSMTLPYVLVAAMLLSVILIPTARLLGKRGDAMSPPAAREGESVPILLRR